MIYLDELTFTCGRRTTRQLIFNNKFICIFYFYQNIKSACEKIVYSFPFPFSQGAS